MNNLNRVNRLWQYALLGIILFSSGCAAQGGTATPSTLVPGTQFKLQDFIGHDWKRELVTYDVPDKTFGRKDLILVGTDNKP